MLDVSLLRDVEPGDLYFQTVIPWVEEELLDFISKQWKSLFCMQFCRGPKVTMHSVF